MNFRHIEEVESTDLGDCIFRYLRKKGYVSSMTMLTMNLFTETKYVHSSIHSRDSYYAPIIYPCIKLGP